MQGMRVRDRVEGACLPGSDVNRDRAGRQGREKALVACIVARDEHTPEGGADCHPCNEGSWHSSRGSEVCAARERSSRADSLHSK
jgi:hypothetical protein